MIDIVAYILVTLVSLAILAFIIRFAVKSGVTAALRAHEAWMRDGSLERSLDAHAEQLAAREQQRLRSVDEIERDRRRIAAERGE